jgi:4-hydroxybenzoate polyprenyltransferase
MATAARGFSALKIYLEMIKFEHSIFALPFAMIGMMWGSRAVRGVPWPGVGPFLWIVVAMVSCRSAAMAFNRIADREIDAENPRTRSRALPAGLLKLSQASFFFFVSCGLFFVAAAMLNNLALLLSPIALGVTLFYSITKRFTPLCHFILGLSLGIAPAAAWIGAAGRLDWAIVPVSAAVLLWTAGFDIIYALQDVAFDREHRLRSLPETVGVERALWVSRGCHLLAVLCLAWAGVLIGAGPIYWGGVAFALCLLAYEQSLVKPDDLSKVNLAFFTLNGFVSMGVFVFAFADLAVRGGWR